MIRILEDALGMTVIAICIVLLGIVVFLYTMGGIPPKIYRSIRAGFPTTVV